MAVVITGTQAAVAVAQVLLVLMQTPLQKTLLVTVVQALHHLSLDCQ